MDPIPELPSRPQLTGLARYLMLSLAGLFMLLGLIGLFLPVMPTVPFLLVALWAASRSSERLTHWLETHPQFGRALCDWRYGGVVPRRAKWLATVMMSGSAVFLTLFAPEPWIAVVVISCMALVLFWLWRRPEVAPPYRRRMPQPPSS